MTIICALYDEQKDEIWLGCNDRATIGDSPAPASASKWLQFGDWAIGVSGDGVYEQFLQLSVDKFPRDTDDPLKVFEFLRKTYEHFNLGQTKDNASTPSYGGDGLLVHRSGGIWDFDSGLALSPVPAGRLWGCGSGVDYALGADFVMAPKDFSARDRVLNAVNAAIALDVGCPGEAMIERFPAV